MKIWTTGIIEAEINSAFFSARNILQPQLNEITSNNYFGESVERILIVFAISRDDIREVRRFTKKDKTLSARLIISYNEFLEYSDAHRISLFVDALKTMLQGFTSFNSTQFNKGLLIENLNSILLTSHSSSN